jgi:hypothetical protein
MAFGQTCPTPSSLATSLVGAAQASILSLGGINPINCPEVAMSQTWTGGRLIFSDSPESPTSAAKLYEDGTLPATTAGNNNRIFLYHVNGNSSVRLKFTVLIKNLGSGQGTLTVEQKGTAGPSNNYIYTGKVAFDRWLSSTASSPVNIAAGATLRLDSTFDGTSAAYQYLMNGIWDYQFTQAHKVTICALNAADDPLTVCPGLSIATRDSHQRGTFPNADKVYDTASGTTIDTASGMQQFPIAGNTTNDSNALGTDVTTGSQESLGGNYGILYRIHLTTTASNGNRLGFLINPRAGAWGGAVNALAGILSGGVFLIPSGTTELGDSTKGALEGEYSPGAGLTTWLQFMPTGGVSLPVRFVAAPY